MLFLLLIQTIIPKVWVTEISNKLLFFLNVGYLTQRLNIQYPEEPEYVLLGLSSLRMFVISVDRNYHSYELGFLFSGPFGFCNKEKCQNRKKLNINN